MKKIVRVEMKLRILGEECFFLEVMTWVNDVDWIVVKVGIEGRGVVQT